MKSDLNLTKERSKAGRAVPVWSRHPWVRKLILLFLYAGGLSLSFFVAYELRFDFAIEENFRAQLFGLLPLVVMLQLILLYAFGQFEGLLSYFSLPDLARLFWASFLAFAIIVLIWLVSWGAYAPPRGVILSDFLISFVGVAGTRLAFRLVRERYLAPYSRNHPLARRVGIVGAGDVGASLVNDLFSKRGLGLLPVGFFDDDKKKWGSRIHGVPVLGAPEIILERAGVLDLEQIIIAMPTAPAKRIGEIVALLRKSRLKFAIVPAMDQLASGQLKVSQIRPVEIQDLLGRDPVQIETESIRGVLVNRQVMVTGAGGSIGSELCRQIAAFEPKQLLLVDQSEVQLFAIEQELIGLGYGGSITPLIADILDEPRMSALLREHRPDVLFHAAAHKHVPMMERQPGEAIKNNSLATARLADLALAHGVGQFVMISTDKAVNPTSVMGATKRLAEIYLQALFAKNPKGTQFIAVRFGNVLGSSGSVVPIFTKQIAAGGPVMVTHPDMVRYFMTIPEAVGLVLQSCAQGQGGETFVLDMGQPVKIAELARQMIELSGLQPEVDIEIQFVGLRPGEKLFEEITCKGEAYRPTQHPRIMRFVTAPEDWSKIKAVLENLSSELHQAEPDRLKQLIKQSLAEYTPDLGAKAKPALETASNASRGV
ncbi:MAG TPA: nucleoside-diphosphate sugar epimerase/dehydratase [Candidatus Saccharimonadales bacterium]|nr:nucleoside-diphosphate sugar epimerase/dehydratase [Candidatus Saccharimonadales bacterium]